MITDTFPLASQPHLPRAPGRSRARQIIFLTAVGAALNLTGCSGTPQAGRPAGTIVYDSGGQRGWSSDSHAPDFATQNFEPFNRQDVVAIALREWRLFDSPIADDDPESRPDNADPSLKPERLPGLWQRVGEYWWIGQDPGAEQSGWTGKQTGSGRRFAAAVDGNYAWSAAFISYVMRIAGANGRFPYAANHATYINAAVNGQSPILTARDPSDYAPQLGDIICVGRGHSRNISFTMLPTSQSFPSHCGIVVAVGQNGAPFGRQINIIGGNVFDAVALTHVPTDGSGHLKDSTGLSYDSRYNWLAVLQVHYDAEEEPDSGR